MFMVTTSVWRVSSWPVPRALESGIAGVGSLGHRSPPRSIPFTAGRACPTGARCGAGSEAGSAGQGHDRRERGCGGGMRAAGRQLRAAAVGGRVGPSSSLGVRRGGKRPNFSEKALFGSGVPDRGLAARGMTRRPGAGLRRRKCDRRAPAARARLEPAPQAGIFRQAIGVARRRARSRFSARPRAPVTSAATLPSPAGSISGTAAEPAKMPRTT